MLCCWLCTLTALAVDRPEDRFRDFDVELPVTIDQPAKLLGSNSLASEEKPLSKQIGDVRESLRVVRESKLFTALLTDADLISLPVGISKTVGGAEFQIVIMGVRITPSGTKIDVGMGVQFPDSDQELIFGGYNIPFSQERGLGGQGKLALLSDYKIPLSKNMSLEFKGSMNAGGTYVEFGCDGYQRMGLDVDMVFDREFIRPADANGEVIEGAQVRANIKSMIDSWDDLVVNIDLPTFRMGEKNDRGFVFTVREAIYDQSAISNGGAMFPAGYESPDFLEGNHMLWKGIYIGKAEVMLPSDFDKAINAEKEKQAKSQDAKALTPEETKAREEALGKLSNQRTTIGVQGLIIDRTGLSGKFYGQNLLSLDKGQLGAGWALSLERIQVEILQDQFIEAQMWGKVQMPTSDSTGVMGYGAQIGLGGDFRFSAQAMDTLRFSPFGDSKLQLTRTELQIELQDGTFYAMADLDGTMDVRMKQYDANLADIAFQGLKIETAEPYISATAFSVSSQAMQQEISGKGMSINYIGLRGAGNRVALDVDVAIALFSEKNDGFGAEGELSIYGERKEEGWKHAETVVSRIYIEAGKKDVFELKGELMIAKGDEIYGDVFKGMIEAKLGLSTKSDGAGVECTVIFGTKDDRDYWYVDGLMTFSSGIPVGGALSLKGFGGGLYYGMDRVGYRPEYKGVTQSATGGLYVPSKTAGFGFKAMVIISDQTQTAFNAEAIYEMSFNPGGGVRKVGLYGCAALISAVPSTPLADGLKNSTAKTDEQSEKAKEKEKWKYESQASEMPSGYNPRSEANCAYIDPKSPFLASMSLDMDFENSTYHGTLLVNIDQGPLQGGGVSVIHFEPGSWYVHIGTPAYPVGLSLLGTSASTYFMLGDNMPRGFQPPSEVAKILNRQPSSDLQGSRDENALGDGRGVAFGVGLKVGLNAKYGPFFAEIYAGMGFDVMLTNYGPKAICANTGKRIGIDGWYAQGQVYAYVKAAIGIEAKVGFIRGRFEIIDAGFAAILSMKGPNPLYASGEVGGHFSILGGALKGRCSFAFQVGEECQIQGGSPLGGMELIASMTPSADAKEVDVFAPAQVVFNVPVEKPMTLLDPTDNKKKTYRIRLKKVELRSNKGGIEQCEQIWNDDQTTLVLQSVSMLQAKANYQFEVDVTFEEKKNGKWVDASQGEKLVKVAKFTSGDRPDFILPQHLAYSYPVDRQMNFFIDENRKGYLKMKVKGWGDLFRLDDPNNWVIKARYKTTAGAVALGNIRYDDGQAKATMDIPTAMQAGKIYTLEIVKMPKQALDVDANVTIDSTRAPSAGGDDGYITTTTRKAEEALESKEEKVIYRSQFRSSQYRTFVAKMEGLKIGSGNTGLLPGSGRSQINVVIPAQSTEGLDAFELAGNEQIKPMVSMEVDFTDEFFKTYINNVIYHQYPLYGAEIDWRDQSSEYGWLKPKYAVFFGDNEDGFRTLTDDEISQNDVLPQYGRRLYYDVSKVIAKDFRDFQTDLERLATEGRLRVSGADKTLTDNIRIAAQAPDLKIGTYHVNMHYRLPGQDDISSTYQLPLTNIIQ